MPTVLSKFARDQAAAFATRDLPQDDPDIEVYERVLPIMLKYKPYYQKMKQSNMKKRCYEEERIINMFKMELMTMGIPKDAINIFNGMMLN